MFCVSSLPAFARIWLGLTMTQQLKYEDCVLQNCEGFIVEVATLWTGDLLMRVPHTHNDFMRCDVLQEAMCIDNKYLNNIVPNRTVWIPKEDIAWDGTGKNLYYDHLTSKYSKASRKLSPSMTWTMLQKPTLRQTTSDKLHKYNDVYYIHQLFLMCNHETQRGFVTKYIERGVGGLEEAAIESGADLVQLDLVSCRLSSRIYDRLTN